MREREYEPFMALTSSGELVERLKGTPYGPFMEAASARFKDPYGIISAALTASLADSFRIVERAAPEAAGPLLKAFFSLWEAYDLKAIIRGIARNVKSDEILDVLVPAGEFDRSSLVALTHSRDIRDLAHFLSTWGSPYAGPVREGMREYSKTGSIASLELSIDRFVFGGLLAAMKGRTFDERLVREAAVWTADVRNIMTLIKTAGEGYSVEGMKAFFIDGGSLTEKAFAGAAALRSRVEVIYRVIELIRTRELRDALAGADPEDVAMLEERLTEALERRLYRASVEEPLSIALAASFLYMKARETKNLRLIARGVEYRMPPDEIKFMLIYPV